MFGFVRNNRVCKCGHDRAAHTHYRPGRDCGLCDCNRFRKGRVTAVSSGATVGDQTLGIGPRQARVAYCCGKKCTELDAPLRSRPVSI
jgi:hypothetical protein